MVLQQGTSSPALTICGGAQPAEDVHQRRLPRAAVAQQRRDLTLVDVKGQICSQGTARGGVRAGISCPRGPSHAHMWGIHSHSPQGSPHPTAGLGRSRTLCGVATFQRHPGKGGENIREVGQGRLNHYMGRGGIGDDASRLFLVMEGSFLGCWFSHHYCETGHTQARLAFTSRAPPLQKKPKPA